jgi:hypothetical protein
MSRPRFKVNVRLRVMFGVRSRALGLGLRLVPALGLGLELAVGFGLCFGLRLWLNLELILD